MKNENARREKMLETARRNEYLFWRLDASKKSNFLSRLRIISQTFSPLKPELVSLKQRHPLEWRTLHRDKVLEFGCHAADSLDEGRRAIFLNTIDALLSDYSLGREWRDPVITYAMIGILCPPVFNLHIEKEAIEIKRDMGQFSDPALAKVVNRYGGRQFKRYAVRTILYLNPDTSQSDIEHAWPEIKKIQHHSWPGRKNFHVTKNSLKILTEQKEVSDRKLSISDDEKYAKLSPYEELLWKHEKRRGKSDAEVAKILRKRGTERGTPRKSVRAKNQKTDQEVVRELFPEKSQKEQLREVNRIRARRRRLKR